MKEQLFPTIEQIKQDYNEIIEKVGSVTTLEQLDQYLTTDKFTTIEINGIFAEDFIKDGGINEEIEWIRYESYGCLDYVYFHIKKGIVEQVLFDVWCDEWDDTFIQDISIEQLTEEAYKRCRRE